MLSPELLGKVLQSAPDAMVIVDTAGVILFASRQITTLAGYEPEEVLERSIETLMPQRFRELHLAHRRAYNRDARPRPMGMNLDLRVQLNLRGAIIPVVFITGHGDIPMAVEAMQHGAHDFLEKPFRDQDLIERIQQALAKDTKARPALEERDGIRARLDSLTAREKEVLALMVQGKPNKIMAHELGVSQRTLEIHRSRVMEKSGAGSLAQLVRMVMDTQPAPHS